MITKFFQFTLFILVAVIAVAKPAQAERGYKEFLQLYDGLLQTHMSAAEKDGIAYNGVDYDGWASDTRHKEALKLLLAQDANAFKAEEKMAFWINAYNFLTIELIIHEDERKTIRNLGGLFTSPWKNHSWTLSGMDYTLDHIEHKILRPMGDARVHFAINCASVSCPDLRMESYKAGKLNQQLGEQTKTTLENKSKGSRTEKGTIYVSKIFDWFKEDFKNGNVKDWLLDYMPSLHAPFTLKYMDYDWSLNKTS